MSSMAKHQRRAMQQVWRVKECPQAGAKRCIVSTARRSVGKTTKVRRYAKHMRAYQINGESRLLSIEEVL